MNQKRLSLLIDENIYTGVETLARLNDKTVHGFLTGLIGREVEEKQSDIDEFNAAEKIFIDKKNALKGKCLS